LCRYSGNNEIIPEAIAMHKRNDREKYLPISIVIPTYNRAALALRAVSSALSQCSKGDEVIVVDDGSDDDTEARLRPYRNRIVYHRVSHGGAGRARNIGMSIAKSPLIAFLDSDDEWMLGKLSLQRAFLNARPDVLFCFTDLKYRDLSGYEQNNMLSFFVGDEMFNKDFLGPGIPFSSLAPLPKEQSDFLVHIGDLYPKQMEREYVSLVTLLFRMDVAGKPVRFPEDLPTREEWEFVGKLARRGLAAYLDCETAVVYRHDGPQLTKIDPLMLLDARLKVLARVWGSDETFLIKEGRRYQKVLEGLRLRRAIHLLAEGQREEARKELRQIKQVPIAYHILYYFPSIITATLLRARKYLLRG
jgi:glycosyltransferase involved in cell wall biosynthesis